MEKRRSTQWALGGLCVLSLVACNSQTQSNNGQSNHTESGTSVTQRALNDTGTTECGTGDASNNWVNCTQTTYTAPGANLSVSIPHPQDGDRGRDVTHPDNADGRVGFSFTKLDSNGQSLPATADQANDDWTCTRDEVTGLIWEVKEPYNAASPRYHLNTFTWYSSDTTSNGGNAGVSDGGTCPTSQLDCDTDGLVSWVNQNGGLCGYDDGWRLPTREELHGITDYGQTITLNTPAIDTDYFPWTAEGGIQTGIYWSASTYAADPSRAWRSFFGAPNAPMAANKSIAMRVRLVHD